MRIPSSWTLYLPCYVIVVTVIRVWFCGAAPLCMVEDGMTVQARTQALQPPHTQISSDTDPWCGEDSQKLTLRAQPELCIMNGGFWKFNSHGWETAGRAMRSWGQWPASAAVSERSHTADWSCLYQTGIYYCFKLKELNLACLQKKEKNSFFLCRHHEMDPGGKNAGLHAVQWELSLHCWALRSVFDLTSVKNCSVQSKQNIYLRVLQADLSASCQEHCNKGSWFPLWGWGGWAHSGLLTSGLSVGLENLLDWRRTGWWRWECKLWHDPSRSLDADFAKLPLML